MRIRTTDAVIDTWAGEQNYINRFSLGTAPVHNSHQSSH
jgi:hypothetical protein